jgi:hypothetical protein
MSFFLSVSRSGPRSASAVRPGVRRSLRRFERRVGLAGLLLAATLSAQAQSSHDLLGSARAAGLAHATTGDAAAVGRHANPAATAALDAQYVVFFAREAYGLAELRTTAAHYARPLSFGGASVGVGAFGSEAYREVHADLALGAAFELGTSRLVRVGARLKGHHTAIQGYGAARAVGLGAGLLIDVLPSLTFGIRATNLTAATLARDTPLPETLALGIAYRAETALLVLLDVFKDVDRAAAVRGGLEARPVEALALRVGTAVQPRQFTAGAGVRLGPLGADLAAERHADLGWTPAASLHLHW